MFGAATYQTPHPNHRKSQGLITDTKGDALDLVVAFGECDEQYLGSGLDLPAPVATMVAAMGLAAEQDDWTLVMIGLEDAWGEVDKIDVEPPYQVPAAQAPPWALIWPALNKIAPR